MNFMRRDAASRGPMKLLGRHGSSSLCSLLLGLLSTGAAHAQVFIASTGTFPFDGTVGEYTTSGATVNAALISVDFPAGIAVEPVPLPASILLMLGGIAGIGASAFRKRAA